MQDHNRLPAALLALRLSVFLVMFVWTLDKFLNPGHAASVFEHFYFLEGIGTGLIYAVGAIELLLVIGFVLGIARRWTYGAILVLHGLSTISSFKMYLDLENGLLFYAAWPMLAACLALYLLRDHDTKWVAGQGAR